MSSLPHPKVRRFPDGFTLAELLVVIGIVGLLLAILLPTLSRIRTASRRVACQSQLGQIGTAIIMRVNDSGGYAPLAGGVSVDTLGWPPDFATALGDAGATRYTYKREPHGLLGWRRDLVTLPEALAPYLDAGDVDVSDSRTLGDLAVFECPGEAYEASLVAWLGKIVGDAGLLQAFKARWDYGANGAVLGFDHALQPADGRHRGLLTSIEGASATFLLTDLSRSHSPSADLTRAYFLSPTGPLAEPYSLSRLVFPRSAADRANATAAVDRRRHGGRTGVLFADGHAESVSVNPDELDAVIVRGASR